MEKPTSVPKWLLKHHDLHRPKLPAGIAAGVISRQRVKWDLVPTRSGRGYKQSQESHSVYTEPKSKSVGPNL